MKPQDMQDLKQLIEFLKEHGVAEFDLDRGDVKIRLKFSQPAGSGAGLSDVARMFANASTGAPQGGVAAAQAPYAAPAAPAPGAGAFVSPGDRVEKGQVICIIEAMKLMNEIEADASGEVVKCLVTNGQPIEFGQPLFAIRTA